MRQKILSLVTLLARVVVVVDGLRCASCDATRHNRRTRLRLTAAAKATEAAPSD